MPALPPIEVRRHGVVGPEVVVLHGRRRIDERRGPADLARRDDLRRRLAAAVDPASKDAVIAELNDRAMAYDPLPDPLPLDAPPVDARGHDETWSDVLRRQAEGSNPPRSPRAAHPC